ncbi:MAG TPA: FliM/FliN family flagellar motor switch protein [Terriglobia bacterium]|nr:FliM/FliN family flagellar motor switch protein [Terriglobia bacterium]
MEAEKSKSAPEAKGSTAPQAQDAWEAIYNLPCQLSAELPIRGFKVRDLLALDVETLLDSRLSISEPVPIWVNGARIGVAEFDVLRTCLAVRMNELG